MNFNGCYFLWQFLFIAETHIVNRFGFCLFACLFMRLIYFESSEKREPLEKMIPHDVTAGKPVGHLFIGY